MSLNGMEELVGAAGEALDIAKDDDVSLSVREVQAIVAVAQELGAIRELLVTLLEEANR